MPLKSNRRKNKSPRRLAPQEEWPSDPLELAHFISQRALWDFYETPTLPSIYYDEVNDVRNGIKSEEGDVYRCRACHIKTYKSFGGLKYHIMQTCDQVPREYYKCLLCDFQDHEQRAIEYHIQ
uniref:Uncharacterized protein n=1 Tax=Ciona savignyi TaxID=51511 RepID=H2ZJT1_CIOSA